MKLERFNKNNKKKIFIVSTIGILLVVGSIVLFKTYAFYEEKKEFNVLKGRIPDFGYDIKMLSVVVDNEEVQEIPEKGDYGVEVECSEGKGSWNYQTWSLNLTEFQKNTKCNITFTSGEMPEDIRDSNSESNYQVFEIKNGTDMKNILPNHWQELTIDNFYVVPPKDFGNSHKIGINCASGNSTVSVNYYRNTFSYDSTTGIFNISNPYIIGNDSLISGGYKRVDGTYDKVICIYPNI